LFAFVALESLGIPLPGETTLIAAAVYAGTTHHLNIGIVFLVAAIAATVGDNAGYWVGSARRQRRLLRAIREGAAHLRGVLRGLTSMRWPRFTMFNAAGGVAWAVLFAFGAFGLGAAATGVGQAITLVGLAVSGVLTVAAIFLARRWMRQLEQRALAADAAVVKAAGKERPAMIGPER
jgi:membrane protein DedA with SNARE-associated domain